MKPMGGSGACGGKGEEGEEWKLAEGGEIEKKVHALLSSFVGE